MDPLSITTGCMAIISYSMQAAQWIQNLKGIDERIAAFASELKALSATHDALHKSLQQPAMRAAARNAEQNAGSDLWKQISQSINDCQDTMAQLQLVLNEIDGSSNKLLRKPLKMFRESLLNGQVYTLRQRINFFNSTLALPLQMMNVTLQIDQQELTAEQNQRLDEQINYLLRTTNRLTAALNGQIPAFGAASQRSMTDAETLVYERLENCLETAKRFCSNASIMSSVKSGASTIVGVRAGGKMVASTSVAGDPLSNARQKAIEDWIPPQSQHSDEDRLSGSPVSTEITSMTNGSNRGLTRGSFIEIDDDDLEFEITKQLITMGQKKLESRDFAGAEKSFRKALAKLESHDLKDKIALSPAEVKLLLCTSCLKQNKFDDVEAMLLPLTQETEDSDILQVSSASSLLGELYLQKADHEPLTREKLLDTALKYAMAAYKGRRQQLGKGSGRCRESARLLVQVYTALGDEDEVEIWEGIAGPLTERPVSTTSDSFVQPEGKLSGSLDLHPIAQTNNELKKTKSRNIFGRNPSTSRPMVQRQKSMEPTSPLLTSGASSIRSIEKQSDYLNPLLLPPASIAEEGPRRSSSWFSTSNKSKSRSPLQSESPAKPRPQLLAIYGDSQLVSREEVAVVKFRQIQELCARGDLKKAAKSVTLFLQAYVENGEVLFEKEISKNIREGGKLGLAATGQGYAPLHFFASLKHECAFEVGLLIKQGVDVNATDAFSPLDNRVVHYRAIQLAAERGHADVVKELLKVPGINIEVTDEEGRTPVFVAFDNGFFNITEMLLDQGAMSTLPRPKGGNWDLLAKATASGADRIVRILLDRDVPLFVHASKTPLLVLAIRSFDFRGERLQRKISNRAKVVQLLLDAGADPHEEDEDGHQAMYYAALEGCADIQKMLETKRAEAIQTMPDTPSLILET